VRDQAPRDDVLRGLLTALQQADVEIVVLLDDLHWADEATLDALRFVGRRIESTRALVVGTFRDDEVGRQHPLRVVVGDLATSPAVRRIPLGPLSPASVEELARGTAFDAVELHHLTGGNPFFVTEVIAGAPTRIPATVRDAVLARAARLSPPARRTLEAAAVVGPTVDPALLAAVVEPVAAEECLARGLLQTDGRHYHFRHEVAREAILQATDPSERITLHARVLAALETEPEDDRSLARLAHHAEGAGDRKAVLRYGPRAARHAAAVGAHREAAAQYARAVRFVAGVPPADRATLLEDYAREHVAIARNDVANRAFGEAIAIWRQLGDARREARSLSEMARSLVAAGLNVDAEAASRRALDVAAPLPDGPEKVEALGTQAYLRMLDRDNREAIELGRRAIEMGRQDPSAISSVVHCWNTVGSSRILLADDGGRADLERSLALALEHGLDRFAVSAYSVLYSALGEMYRFDAADAYFEAGHRYATERDLDSSRLYLESWRAIALVHRGRWSEAGALATSVLARQEISAISRMMALLALGRLRARRGDPDVWNVLDEGLAMAEPTATLQRIGPIRAARAEAAWLAGDAERSGTEAAAAFDLAARHAHPWHIGELGWWMTRAGHPPVDTAGAAEPWRLQLAGQWREAATAWQALGCPYEAARALLDADDTAAIEEAHATFDRLGARPAAALAARRLRELGAPTIPRGRRAATRANPAGLTARELEVLRLVARGLANHDIAARLFLSTRTVDHHVSALLGKLGIAGRADAAAAATGLGIDLQNGQPVSPD
jgi:DNA-binding CsgD family transcriptional regulator